MERKSKNIREEKLKVHQTIANSIDPIHNQTRMLGISKTTINGFAIIMPQELTVYNQLLKMLLTVMFSINQLESEMYYLKKLTPMKN